MGAIRGRADMVWSTCVRYRMKQKIFALGDDYAIEDEDGRHVATVDGKVFTLRQKLLFLDKTGAEVARIEKKILALKPTYELIRGDTIVATVSKDFFTLFRCSFTVDVPGPDDLAAQGNFTDHEYVFSRGNRRVATVSKSWFSIRDTYGVDISDGEDTLLVLASTVVIDLCCDEERRERERD